MLGGKKGRKIIQSTQWLGDMFVRYHGARRAVDGNVYEQTKISDRFAKRFVLYAQKNSSPIKSLFRKTRNLCEKALFVRGLSGFSCNKKHGCLLIFRKKHGTIPVVKREVVRFQFNF